MQQSSFTRAHNDYLEPPDDGYDSWAEAISEQIKVEDWTLMEDWFVNYPPQKLNAEKAINFCWKQDYTPEEAAFYITRYFHKNVKPKLSTSTTK